MRKLFLIVAFALSLTVGCGGNRNVEEISKTEGISDTETGTAAADPLPTAEPEPTEEPVRFYSDFGWQQGQTGDFRWEDCGDQRI